MRSIHDIPMKFPEKFPPDFDNRIQYWGFFTREEIETNRGKLLMLDFDFGGYCSLNCPDCYRRHNVIDEVLPGELSFVEQLKVIDDAMKLGLRSVKVCGKGEPTENTRFLELVRELSDRGLGCAVFTAGQVLGDDRRARQFNQRFSIRSARHLCDELAKLRVSFMLKFQSFNPDLQNKRVGMAGYTPVRDQALLNLVAAGFNNEIPTRLATCSNPIVSSTAGEVFDIHVWSRRRNIYPITACLMVSGKQIDKRFVAQNDITTEEKLRLWERIYRWNLANGLQTLPQIERDGVSVLPGMHPCNQIAVGLYVSLTGNVVMCPGATYSLGNVKHEPLSAIWQRYVERSSCIGAFNCRCPPKDGVTIPNGLYDEILKRLRV